MNKYIIASILILLTSLDCFPGEISKDTVKLPGVVVTANRLPFALTGNPGAVSYVSADELSLMPRTIAVDEALRLVPGVRIDNQHNGERVHLSIRGQGILTERGLRGIGVMLDGLPLNDPSGFASDLYDVDWASVSSIEVLRGPVAGLYGGGGSAGMINISTASGPSVPIGGNLEQSFGSNGFAKSFLQLGGTMDSYNYRINFSRTDGDGHRDHQAFWGNKLYEKINFQPAEKLFLTQIFSHTDYFHQNPEGLNIGQFDNLKQANPDASPFNEYQKTNRSTIGLTGKYIFDTQNDLQAYAFLRNSEYKETSNRYAEYRVINFPGAGLQYNFRFGAGELINNFSIGADFKWQDTKMYKLQSASDTNRKESTDETNLETNTLLANQLIDQSSLGAFLLYNLSFDKFNLFFNLRYDNMKNGLTDKMLGLDTAKTDKDFDKTTYRLGASYSMIEEVSFFANWSRGFLPPSTEELASNPIGYSGFNTHLVPAVSDCKEFGLRGLLFGSLFYDLTGFYMTTENDFFRFKQRNRGNQEVFYGNAGDSRRYGLEVYLSFNILENLKLDVAYTYSDFQYSGGTIDPVYTDTAYVLTTPPAKGQWLPNSPKHQLFAEAVYGLPLGFKLSLELEHQSQWAIYTDARAYAGLLDKSIYQNWQDGFTLIHARLSYPLKIWDLKTEFSIFVRNISDETYMAFTEPDPDGNSYQPGPGREFFGSIKINF